MVSEDCGQPCAEAILHPGIVGMMLVESPLNSHQAFAQADDHTSWNRGFRRRRGLRARLLDGDWDFILELNAVPQTVVDIEIGHLVSAGRRVSVANPAKVNLPVPVAGSFGIVGSKWGASLSVSRGNEQEGQKHEGQNRA